MKRITQTDKYAIYYLIDQHKDLDYISNELKHLSRSSIKNVIDAIPKKEQIIADEPIKKTTDPMLQKTAVKKQKIAVMTEGAAQRNDEFVKALPSSKINTDSYIYRRPE